MKLEAPRAEIARDRQLRVDTVSMATRAREERNKSYRVTAARVLVLFVLFQRVRE